MGAGNSIMSHFLWRPRQHKAQTSHKKQHEQLTLTPHPPLHPKRDVVQRAAVGLELA